MFYEPLGMDILVNPWRDGGCVPSAPVSLTANLKGDGTASVSWEAPESNGGALLSGYRIEWWSTDAGDGATTSQKHVRYDDWSDEPRPNEVSETIDGLTDGVGYTVRVLAYNPNGDGSAVEVRIGEPEPNSPATGLPTIDGIARVGETLTADTSGIHDDDGLNNASFSYQWVTVESNSKGDIEGSPNDGSIYAAAMTVGEFTSCILCVGSDTETWLGYHFPRPSSTYGALSQDSFLLRDGVDYGVAAILLANSERVQMVLLPHPQDIFRDLLQGFALRLDDLEFPFNEANVSDFGVVKYYVWEDPGLSWSDGQQVNVSIVDFSESATPPTDGTGTLDVKAADAPSIGGKAQVGRPLTAYIENIGDASNLGDTPWSEAEITGATSSNYTLTDSDAGMNVRVRVSFTDDASNEQTLSSAATVVVAATKPEAPQEVRLSDHDANSLDVSWEAPSSDGGSPVTGYRVRWKEAAANWDTPAEVSEAEVTGTTYTITGLTGGVEYAVRVSATNDVGDGPASGEATGTPASAAPAEEQPPAQNTQATGAPIIDGAARVSQTLTADTSGIDDEDELTNVAFSYQWLADDADIAGATGAAYTLVADDEGKAIKVVVSFTDDRGNEETLASDPTGEVAPESGPLTAFTMVDASTDPDTLLGALVDEGTLILGNPTGGEYGIRVDTDSNDDIHKVELALSGAKDKGKTEWEPPYSLYGDSGGDNLTGEDLPVGSYTLTAKAYDTNGDVLGTLTVSFTVEAQEQTAVPNNEPTGSPTIGGFARVGGTLTADISGISDDDGLTNVAFSYSWTRSDGTGDTNIQDATGSSYTLTEEDEGKTIKVTVSFTDDAGNTESLPSDPTGEVAPESGPLTAFALVDTSSDPDKVLGTLEDGRTLTLAAPAGDSYGIRVDTDPNHDDHDDIHKVVLALSGAKNVNKPEWEPPYSLYGDSGSGQPGRREPACRELRPDGHGLQEER